MTGWPGSTISPRIPRREVFPGRGLRAQGSRGYTPSLFFLPFGELLGEYFPLFFHCVS
jgi:hypothetical protein